MQKTKTKQKNTVAFSERDAFLAKRIPLSARKKYRVIPHSFIEMRKKEMEEIESKREKQEIMSKKVKE